MSAGPTSFGEYFNTPPDFSGLYDMFEDLAAAGLIRFTSPTTIEVLVPREHDS